jgi:hypothetical protein
MTSLREGTNRRFRVFAAASITSNALNKEGCDMPLFRGWVNPLRLQELDLNVIEARNPTAENILDFLTAPQLDMGVDAFCQRYREIAALNDPIPIAPSEPTILEKRMAAPSR